MASAIERWSDTWMPSRAPGVDLVDDGGVARLVGPGGNPEALLNDTALALWQLCDGRTTVAEMLGAIDVLFAGDRERIADDVRTTLATFRRLGVLG